MPPEVWVLVGVALGLLAMLPAYQLICWMERRFGWEEHPPDGRRW